MKTKASIMGHPIHMGLAHFPVAFLIGAFAFDVAAKVLALPQLAPVAAYLLMVGLPTAAVAAIPGIVDFFMSVPRAARANAIRHVVVSVLGMAAFGAAFNARGGVGGEVGSPELILEGIGALLIGLSGFFGGSLVLKDLIGPDTEQPRS